MSQKKPELKFKYVFTYDYNPIYINGAQGGVSPRGELVMNFYLERPPLPNSVTHEVNVNGTIGAESEVEPQDLNNSLVRFISNGVVLNYDTARNLHSWLGDRLKELEGLEQAKTAFRTSQQQGGSDTSH